jgi:hypothetical protein
MTEAIGRLLALIRKAREAEKPADFPAPHAATP